MTPAAGGSKVDLAHETDFVLGGLNVSPSACRVTNNGSEERVEPRVMEVLIVLHRNAGRTVTREQLIEACWEGRAVSDDAITRAIVKVRQLGRAAEPPHFTLETVPRIGFRLVASPPRPPEAPVENARPSDEMASTPPGHQSNFLARLRHLLRQARIARTAGVVLALSAFGILTAWSLDQRDWGAVPVVGQVAVMPFAAMRPEPEVVRLSRGAGEVVAQRLAAAGVPTVFDQKSPALRGRAMADSKLSVTGNVDLKGDRYVIKGSISDRASGLILWSGTFERQVGASAGLDEEYGRAAAGILTCALGERKAAPTPMSNEVFSLFLSSCDSMIRQSERAPDVARRLVDKAPTIAGAHAHLALALAERANMLDQLSEEAAALTKGVHAAAKRALDLDPLTVNAHVALGSRIGLSAGWAERERHLRRALEIDADHFGARMHYHLLLREVGRLGAAGEMLTSLEGTPGGLLNSAFLHAMSGDLPNAHRLVDRLEIVRPDWARSARWTIATWWEDPRAAVAKLPALLRAYPSRNGPCLEAHVRGLARAVARPVRGLPAFCAGLGPDWAIRMLARQGDIDGAYELMAQPLPRTRGSRMFLFYPEMRAFRQDKRFMPLAERLGILSYWRETQSWPDFCLEPDLPYECRSGAHRTELR